MTENFVNQINLDYLINTNQLKNHLEKTKNQTASRKDKKFYRKRIMNLTKDLLMCNELEEPLLPDVKGAFENYVKICVEYFKTLDECDIIQEDYSELEELDTLLSNNKNLSLDDANNLLMRSVKVTSLDKLVKRTILKKEEVIMPIQKEINLNEPYLKNKGICQKKNIINK
jgi:fibrillarin-like rRNA methylase